MKSASLILTAMLLDVAAIEAHAPGRRAAPRERVEYVEVRHGGHPYFYREGFYYHRVRHGYYLVPPPVGMVIRFRPAGAVLLRSAGLTFFFANGVYYREIPEGYVVAEKPATVIVEENDGQGNPFMEPAAETVMVQNSNGSKTPVRLERSGSQWKGPRGELYDSLPGNEQLRPVYGF
jgi:hypothetical protein